MGCNSPQLQHQFLLNNKSPNETNTEMTYFLPFKMDSMNFKHPILTWNEEGRDAFMLLLHFWRCMNQIVYYKFGVFCAGELNLRNVIMS